MSFPLFSTLLICKTLSLWPGLLLHLQQSSLGSQIAERAPLKSHFCKAWISHKNKIDCWNKGWWLQYFIFIHYFQEIWRRSHKTWKACAVYRKMDSPSVFAALLVIYNVFHPLHWEFALNSSLPSGDWSHLQDGMELRLQQRSLDWQTERKGEMLGWKKTS